MTFSAPILAGRAPLRDPVVLAHFLPWFTRADVNAFPLAPQTQGLILPPLQPWRHWRDSRSQYRRTHLHQPLWGLYDSRDPEILQTQFTTAHAYGLDGFIVNLYGKNSVENVLGLTFLGELEKYNAAHPDRPFVYVLSFDAQAQWPSEGKTPVSIEQDMIYLRETWTGQACLRRDSRIPILVFSYDRPAEQYRAAMTSAFGPDGFDLLWLNHPAQPHMDAGYPWVRPQQIEPDHRWFSPDDTGAGYIKDFYRKCNDNTKAKYLCGGVWPGFNDQFVRWAWSGNQDDPMIRPRVICRETSEGSTLDLTWQATADYILRHRAGDAAARLPMPLIQIVTWNDWNESTQVEPSRDLGHKDLETCKRYIDLLKNLRQ